MNKAWIWLLVHIRALAGDARGGSYAEYALMLAVAILVVVIAVRNFGGAVKEAVELISGDLDSAVKSST